MQINQQNIDRGTPNGGDGDTAREGARKINENFEFLYNAEGQKKVFILQDNTLSAIKDAINNADPFEIKYPESFLFIGFTNIADSTSTVKKTYTLTGKKRGVFGLNQTFVGFENLNLSNTTGGSSKDLENAPGTVTEDLGDLGATSVKDYINGLTNGLTLINSTDTLTVIKAIVNSLDVSYRYVGLDATYGANDSTITDSNLELLEQETQPVDNSTGLEAIDEGNGIGWRLIGRDANNYGSIGKNSIDLSRQFVQKGATGNDALAIGVGTEASGTNSRAEGSFTKASGNNSHSEGDQSIASGNNSHSQGSQTVANGGDSHAEGEASTASGTRSHAEGLQTVASGKDSHAEGRRTTASGDSSYSNGRDTLASGTFSDCIGDNNFARSKAEHSGGIYGTDYTPANDDTDRLVNYGNGQGSLNRSDAFTIFKNGAVRIFRATLASIQNTVKEGFLIFNSGDNNRPYIHNGTEWKGLAYKNVGYTVANLPTGEVGQTAYVTDAASISYRAVATGGGTETALVFFDNNNNWIYH